MNPDKTPTAESPRTPPAGGRQTSRISTTTLLCIALICLIFLTSALILQTAVRQETAACHEEHLASLNDYFSALYTTSIRPSGEAEMAAFLSTLTEPVNENRDRNDTGRIEQIAAFATANVTNEFWEEAYSLPSTEWRYLDPYTGIYACNTEGKVRALPPSPWAGDPYWFLWYRMGCCSEIAALTAFTAGAAGYEARVVRADLTAEMIPGAASLPSGQTAESHSWTEVRVNGTWRVVDADLYAQYRRFGRDDLADDWYTLPAAYHPYTPEQVVRVYLTETGESASDRYTALAGPE